MTLIDYLRLSFVQYALVVSILTALCAALVGVPLVLKRYSLIGSGLSHVAFAGLALSAVINLKAPMFLVIPLTIAVAILLLAFGRNAKVKGDASVAMISIGALALGYFLLNTFPVFHFTGDIAGALFGDSTQMVTLTTADIWLSVGMAVLVIGFFVFFYNKIFAITFDADFMKATGAKAKMYEILVAVLIAIVVSLSMRLVGSLLTAALIIFPALSAMRLFKDFKKVVICSGIISVICATFGMLSAIVWEGTPVGATIVMANIAIFGVCFGTGLLLKQ
ncbi:MAG: metal ABC transporter permease [Firmicutes bacterium]|nr:metal ABC transporter permease [Bacillota bacterium]